MAPASPRAPQALYPLKRELGNVAAADEPVVAAAKAAAKSTTAAGG